MTEATRLLIPSGRTLLFDGYSAPTFSDAWTAGAAIVEDEAGQLLGGIARSAWFTSARIAQLLYDDGNGATAQRSVNRWHRYVDIAIGKNVRIKLVEVVVALDFPSISTTHRIVQLIAHLESDVGVDTNEIVRQLYPAVRLRKNREELCDRIETELGGEVRFSRLNDFNMSEDIRFTQHPRRIFSVLFDSELVDGPIIDQQALALRARELATLHTDEARTIAPGKSDRAQDDLIDLSGDWSGIVLRDGAAFIMAPGGSHKNAAMYVSTIYSDTLVLARLQSRIVDELAIAASERVYSRRHLSVDLVRPIEVDVARFRATYSATSTSLPGRARELINRSHKQMDYDEALKMLAQEVSGMSAIAQLHSSQQVEKATQLLNTVLAFLSIFGFPLSVALSLWASLDGTPAFLGLYLGTAIGIGLAVYGVLVAGSQWILRKGRTFRHA